MTNFCYRASHGGVKTIIKLDLDLPTGHVHGNIPIAQAKFESDSCGSGAAAAGSERVARSAFPYFDLDIRAICDLHELNIGAVWKTRVGLDCRAIAMGHF